MSPRPPRPEHRRLAHGQLQVLPRPHEMQLDDPTSPWRTSTRKALPAMRPFWLLACLSGVCCKPRNLLSNLCFGTWISFSLTALSNMLRNGKHETKACSSYCRGHENYMLKTIAIALSCTATHNRVEMLNVSSGASNSSFCTAQSFIGGQLQNLRTHSILQLVIVAPLLF